MLLKGAQRRRTLLEDENEARCRENGMNDG